MRYAKLSYNRMPHSCTRLFENKSKRDKLKSKKKNVTQATTTTSESFTEMQAFCVSFL